MNAVDHGHSQLSVCRLRALLALSTPCSTAGLYRHGNNGVVQAQNRRPPPGGSMQRPPSNARFPGPRKDLDQLRHGGIAHPALGSTADRPEAVTTKDLLSRTVYAFSEALRRRCKCSISETLTSVCKSLIGLRLIAANRSSLSTRVVNCLDRFHWMAAGRDDQQRSHSSLVGQTPHVGRQNTGPNTLFGSTPAT